MDRQPSSSRFAGQRASIRGGTTPRIRLSTQAIIIGAGACMFAAHAACYFYFFVDDAAIPAVYAQNLLAGRGLVYNALEGRVEGYSDFLHVLVTTALLAFTRAAHLPKLEILHLGMALSFALGIGVVILAGALLARAGARAPALAAGVGFLALAGPLAVWSCSSLEAVPFAFVVTALAGATLFEPLRPRAAVVFAILAVLYRLDGFVFGGAVLAGAFIALDRPARRVLLARVCVPVAAATAAYHLFRFAYFHSLLSAPLEAKVLYKLSPARHVLVKAPEHSYLGGFIELYGIALAPALLIAAAAIVPARRGRGLVLATALMTLYADLVGDWMFGWRFLVPILPLAAIVIGLATARLRARLAWLVAALVLVWSAAGARAFAREFVGTEHKPIWWTSPRDGQKIWLEPYADLVATGRKLVAPGETIAYNQAGLVPFLLDAENIDDLGICSIFEARLPTTDVYFTEVGRYAPLTPAPVFSAVHAYLLYRDVRMLISRTDLLMSANHTIPKTVLDGYFKLQSVDASGENAIYLRTAKPADAFHRDPALFQEDLIHTSRIQRADIDGQVLPDERIGPSFPFLRWQTGSLTIHNGAGRLALRFSARDEDVSTLFAGLLAASSPVTITFSVFNEAGRLVTTEETQAAQTPIMLLRPLSPGTRGRLLVIDMRSTQPDATVTFSDLRLNGQSGALKDYISRSLRFPASQ